MFYPTKMTTGQAYSGQNKEEAAGNEVNRQSAMMSNALGSNLDEFGEESKGTRQINMYSGLDGEKGIDIGNKLFDEGEKFM